MSIEQWVAGNGVGFTWTAGFTASVLDSLANGSSVLSDTAIANQTALDIFCDVSMTGGSITVAAPAFIGIYIYPLNSDGSTYGDGRFGSAAAGVPPSNYYVGSIGCPTGAAAWEGSVTGIVMPPGTFKFVVYNQLGNTLVGTGGNTFKYRTYNRSIV